MKTIFDDRAAPLYEFDDFRIDPIRRHLHRLDAFVHVPPKVFDTLLTLVRHRGRILDKDELIETIWPDTNVEENNLTQNISAIRKALGDNRGEHRYVVTIPGRGYSFVADVRERSHNGEQNRNGHSEIPFVNADDIAKDQFNDEPTHIYRSQTRFRGFRRRYLLGLAAGLVGVTAIPFVWSLNKVSITPNIGAKSIAVLPFESLNAEESEKYIGTGMADALITKLSNIRQIAVRPTSSILRNANLSKDSLAAGRELGVDFVIDGHLQRIDDRLRITVQMIRTSDGAALWARPFDEKFTGVFAMQDSISEQIASALQLQLSGDEHRQIVRRYTESTAAYQAYMKASYLMNEPENEKVKKSVEYYQQAIDLDPDYALAYAGLADAHMRLHARGIPGDKVHSIDLARDAVTKALQIDDTVAYAHSILGFIAFRYEWEFSKAEREYNRARELDPNYVNSWFGFYLITVDRFAEAESEFKRYREARPLEATDLGLYYYFLRKYDLAENELRNALEINPHSAPNRAHLGTIYEQKGMLKEAIAEFVSGRELSSTKGPGGGNLAHAFAISGRKSEAKKILADMVSRSTTDYFSANYMVAVVNAGLGNKDEAIAYLERACDEHSLGPAWLRFDPRLDGLRQEPSFKAIMRRVGLADL